MASNFYNVGDRKLYHSDFDLNWIHKYIGNPDKVDVILEFGSFDCGDGYRFKQHCKNSQVYSIEACPKRFEIIKDFARINGIKVFNCAISDEDGESDFYQCLDPNEGTLRYGPAGSILKRTEKHTNQWRHLSYPPPIKVKALKLDTFCDTNDIKSIDVLFMDVEGMEERCLRGLTKINPKLIYLEKHLGGEWYSGGYNEFEMNEYVLSRGYTLAEATGTDNLYVLKDMFKNENLFNG